MDTSLAEQIEPSAEPSRSDIRRDVFRYLQEIASFPESVIHESSRLDDELAMKSIVFVELQVALEDEWDIEIDPLRVIECNELGRVIDYIYDAVLARADTGHQQ